MPILKDYEELTIFDQASSPKEWMKNYRLTNTSLGLVIISIILIFIYGVVIQNEIVGYLSAGFFALGVVLAIYAWIGRAMVVKEKALPDMMPRQLQDYKYDNFIADIKKRYHESRG